MRKIYQIYGQDAHDMTMKLLEASGAIGLVLPGGSVALKPNLVVAGTAESGTITHVGLLVDLPVLKGHCQTVMTCALKNLKGCLPDKEKRRFHALGLQKPIAALGAGLKPRLIVVDSICGDLDFEEGGTPVQTNRMYLGADAVQLDAYGCSLMGLNPEAVPYIALAEQYGGGSAKWSSTDIVELNRPSDAATHPKPSGTAAGLNRHVHENQACSACFAALLRALHVTRSGQDEEVYIGQGWQGKELDGLGIGKCCCGAAQCVMGCPPTAQAIAKKLEEPRRG